MSDFKWYVVRVISGREEKIKDHVLLEVEKSGLTEKVRQILVP